MSGVIFGSELIITGQISETSSGSHLRFEGNVLLDNNSTINDWTGGTTIASGGGLGIYHSGSLPSSGDVVIGSGGSLLFASSDTDPYTLSGNIIFAGGSILINSGDITFSGAVGIDSSATITINGGTTTFSGICGIRYFQLNEPSTVHITGVLIGDIGCVFQGLGMVLLILFCIFLMNRHTRVILILVIG